MAKPKLIRRITINPYGSVLGGKRYKVMVWGKRKKILHAKSGFKSKTKAEKYRKELRRLNK